MLYIFPFPISHIPFGIGKFISECASSFWQFLTPLFAKSILGYEKELSFWGRGSGDTTYNYLLLLLRIVLTFLTVIIWSVTDKLRKKYGQLEKGLIVLLRYYLAFIMFSYGFSKVFYLQFPELNLMNLTRTFGDSSPMGLLWKFMGYSEAYSIFSGLMEVIGGIFLLFRKTKILGALVIFGVMFNVFMLNMTFDVPVKLFSFHLCVVSLIILIPDYKNLFRFLFLNRPTQPNQIKNYSKNKTRNWIGYGIKAALVCYMFYGNIDGKISSQKKYGKRAPESELYGIYEMQKFAINGNMLPPLMTDTLRWKSLVIDKTSSLIIRMDNSRIGMKHEIDTVKGTIFLKPYLDKYDEYHFDYVKTDSILMLKSFYAPDTITITSKKRNREDFFLINRGFHWINEYPMQR
ncbi:MAG: hypothetical protein ABJU26_13470 [Flavobacteriaceae bacterium]